MSALVPVLIALAAGPLTGLLGLAHRGLAGPVAVGMAGVAFGASALAWWGGSTPVDLPWAPTWGLRLRFAFDGLAALYALLATAVGVAITVYATAYLPRHLRHQERSPGEVVRFHAFVLLFMGAMVGLVTARDGLLLFLFWDLTAVTSYLLIGFDRERAEARAAALMALLVTGITSILFLAGAVLLRGATGSFAIDDWLAHARAAPPAAIALVTVAALAKSAQVPLHFWLPRAMTAPTPVSAYLHSAAMVAAGVFVLTRLHPLLAEAAPLPGALAAVGVLSMAIGGLLALVADELKQVLAYSTIAHYGYVTLLLGLGGDTAVLAASLYVLAHGVAKSALFLAAGAVTEATGETRLSRVGGLGRRLPVLAAATAVAAATLAGLPLTLGYFKDELLLTAALEHSPAAVAAAVGGAALSLAYAWRFWAGVFLGHRRGAVEPIERRLVAPIVGLAALALLGGLVPGPAGRLAAAAAGAVRGDAPVPELAYHLAKPETWLALAAWLGGIALVVCRDPVARIARALWRASARRGPERAYQAALHRLNVSSRRILAVEQRDLRGRLTPVLAPSAALVAIAVVATSGWRRLGAGEITLADTPLALALGVAGLAAIATTGRHRHLAIAVTLSAVGFSLAAAYAFLGAPDVALVAVLVETLLTLLFVGMLALFPARVLRAQVRRAPPRRHRWRDVLVAVAAAGLAFAVALDALSGPVPGDPVAAEHLRRTPEAHGRDAVTVILADFRGLDTLGEITVLTVAFAGVLTLLGRRRT